MRPIAHTVLTGLLAATLVLPGCVNTSGKSSNEVRLAPSHVVSTPTSPEAEVKPAPEPAPPAAAPPANVPLVNPPTAPTPPPASPEEQTKATLEPKAVQAAALPQPKSEPAKEKPEAAAKAAGPKAPEAETQITAGAGETKKTEPAAEKAKAGQSPEPTVAVVGDSLAVGIGITMAQRINKFEGVGCEPLGKVSTGLISKKFFDWEKKLSELVAKEKLSAVVVMMGGNDANNPIAGKAAGTPEWGEAYREKAESFLRIASSAGVKVLWVGLPAMRDAAYNKRVVAVNAAAKAACGQVGGCSYMDASDIFTDASGNYVQAKDIGGKKVSLRAKDGVHMTMNGYDLLCKQVLDKLATDGALPGGK